MIFCLLLTFFQNYLLRKILSENTVRVSNGLDLDQAVQNVGPDLCLNCLQRLSADDKSHGWQARVNNIFLVHRFYC